VTWHGEASSWACVQVHAGDERIRAARGDSDAQSHAPARESLLSHAPLRAPNKIWRHCGGGKGFVGLRRPEDMRDSARANRRLAPGLDLAHLGLGPTGHTLRSFRRPVLIVTDGTWR